jgi:hypothetical protein
VRKLLESIDRDEPTILAMLNQFLNSLSTTSDHRFAAGHRLEVHASKALVPAGQHENGAALHGLCYSGPALPSNKLNLLPNPQVANQCFELGAIRPFSDDAASQLGKRSTELSQSPQNKFVAFAA